MLVLTYSLLTYQVFTDSKIKQETCRLRELTAFSAQVSPLLSGYPVTSPPSKFATNQLATKTGVFLVL